MTTRRGTSCYDDCQQAYSAVELEERTGAEIPWGDNPPPKKEKNKEYKITTVTKDLDPENIEKKGPTFKDFLSTDDSEEMDLEEISSVGAVSGGSLPLDQKPKYFKDSQTKEKS